MLFFCLNHRQPDQQLSTNTDGQMTSLLDALTIYRSVISLNPSEAALVKCCETASMTPHLDLLIMFGRHVHSWFKYASGEFATPAYMDSLQIEPQVLPSKARPMLRVRGCLDNFLLFLQRQQNKWIKPYKYFQSQGQVKRKRPKKDLPLYL